jgi:hypothetical protein
MVRPLVTQLHFTRSEFRRCLQGLSAEEAMRRIGPMNCISWIIGHLASQENRYWVLWAQGQELAPGLEERVGAGRPASTPLLEEMWDIWDQVTESADRYLQNLSQNHLQGHLQWQGKPLPESVGTMLLRNIYHYWFHLGEAHAIRQMLGHTDLPQFVGDMSKALCCAETEGEELH